MVQVQVKSGLMVTPVGLELQTSTTALAGLGEVMIVATRKMRVSNVLYLVMEVCIQRRVQRRPERHFGIFIGIRFNLSCHNIVYQSEPMSAYYLYALQLFVFNTARLNDVH